MEKKLDVGALVGVSNLNTGDMQVQQIPLALIDESQDNRYDQRDIDELAESIEVIGLQQPLVVQAEGERYRLIAGHRRRNALALLARETAPCIVLAADLDPAIRTLIREAADRLDALRGPAIIPQAEMTREELRQWFAEWLEDYYDELHTEDDLTPEVAESALVALRTPTREQVEGIRGEWMFPIFADQEDANDPRCQCSECGSIETPLVRHRFCPACGAPMTDEAVDIVMRRLEALKDGKGD